MSLLASFLRDESGATAVEYGLLAAGLALAIFAAVSSLGTKMSGAFSSLSTSIK